MKILSNKEYYRLVNKIDILTRDNDCMNRKLDEMKENKPFHLLITILMVSKRHRSQLYMHQNHIIIYYPDL